MKFPGSLHNHSHYSNLRLRDAIVRETELIDYAIELGHDVIAFTEHESISNAIKIEKYYNKIKKDHPDFKIILGNEIYLCRDGLNGQNFEKGNDRYYHFILLAKDAQGHQQIRELSSRAWMRSYKTGKMRRVPTYYQDLIDVIGAAPGHVVGSTACLGGFLDTKLLQWVAGGRNDQFYQQIIGWVKNMEGIFGKGNFFLEMQPAATEEQEIANKELFNLSEITGIPYIITTDTHYLKKEDAPIHKAFLNSQDGDREVDSFYATTYLMSTTEIESYFHFFTEQQLNTAYSNITKIKEMCEDFSLLKPLKIPSLDWRIPQAFNQSVWDKYVEKIPYLSTFMTSDFKGDQIMARLIVDKLESDTRLQYQESYDEINSNLEITWISSEVNKAHWSAYFLNLQKIIDVCWDSGTIVGPGRGSGVGFYLLYILDIIQINPLWETTRTFSWRFLNPDRVSVLDIDTDVESGRRAHTLQALREYYGEERVSNVATFGTEKSKSAIQTAARGLGIDVDVATYIASLIPADRGKLRTLSQCYYGDDDYAPIPLFIQQMNEYPELWEVAQKIEGLICRLGEHAGGVIFVDEPLVNSTALMKVPNGDTVTQFDLHDCEDCSLIKIDLLSTECEDKIHTCLDLLADAGYIDWQPTLRETYNKYLDIYALERDDPKMWEMVWNHEIQSLFQMEKQSGIQGIALIKPESVDELAVLNSVIRLMAPDKDSEQPLETWAKYRENIGLWYKEMRDYGLTEEEISWLSTHSAITEGICESQEGLMSLVQEERLGGHNLNFADKCRKALAKKIGSLFDECETTFFETLKEKQCSDKLGHYVWDVLLRVQRGYSFNRSHCLAYSLVGLQEMNLAFKYPVIFWNCACLITDSGGTQSIEDEEGEIVDIYEPEDFEEYEYVDAADKKTKEKKKRAKSNDYDKIASAIGKMRNEGIDIAPPDINKSTYTFNPNVEENKIYFGLRGILNVGEEVIEATIANRPYISPKDYLQKVKPKKSSMISLIKGGAFDSMIDRKLCMAWYLWETCDKKNNLTLQNMPGLMKYGLLPTDTENQITARKVYEFNRYLKAVCKLDSKTYQVDERAINFLIFLGEENLLAEGRYLDVKTWDKVYQNWMAEFRTWIAAKKDEILSKLNDCIFKEAWLDYASGSLSSWEMEVLCFYYHKHELAEVNTLKYGFSDFNLLPEDPIVERSFSKGGKTINIFKLTKICGTCIAKNKDKGLVTLLTPTGVVTVKFRKEYFAMFDKQISERGADGKKHVIEKSWFNRGSMIVVQGMRSGDAFVSKKYASSGGHQLYKINEVIPNGDIVLQIERYQGGIAEDEEN